MKKRKGRKLKKEAHRANGENSSGPAKKKGRCCK